MEFMDLLSDFFRWFHIAAGLLFVGLNWFFNFVFIPFTLSTLAAARINAGLAWLALPAGQAHSDC